MIDISINEDGNTVLEKIANHKDEDGYEIICYEDNEPPLFELSVRGYKSKCSLFIAGYYSLKSAFEEAGKY